MVKCSNCGSYNREDIKICLNCGRELNSSAIILKGQLQFKLDFSQPEEISNQIHDHFFRMMRYRIETELDPKGYRSYFDHFHSSGFYQKVDVRVQQLAEEVISIHEKNESSELEEFERLLKNSLEAFIDYFVIVFCKPLHKMQLPEAILRYGNIQEETLDFGQMIMDYLDFENEKDKVYTDFLKMPVRKLKNAKEAFLFAENDEKLFFVCDQTVFGSCKEGYAMTDKALYWKPHFNDPSNVIYNELETIVLEGEWITINDQFFNVNKTLNYKMIKLLKKIKNIFS